MRLVTYGGRWNQVGRMREWGWHSRSEKERNNVSLKIPLSLALTLGTMVVFL
jgi:hypothetical protein